MPQNKNMTNPELLFFLDEYNPRRRKRGVEAARVYISYDEGKTWDWLWMSPDDIRKNIRWNGSHPELIMALDAYERNQEIRGRFRSDDNDQTN